MNRQEIIDLIFGIKPEAVAKGFDWPTEESTENVSTETLREFLEELIYFLEE
jgi:hypothetical protein